MTDAPRPESAPPELMEFSGEAYREMIGQLVSDRDGLRAETERLRAQLDAARSGLEQILAVNSSQGWRKSFAIAREALRASEGQP